MHHIGAESPDRVELIKEWIRREREQGRADFVNDLTCLVADLDGICDGATDILQLVGRALQVNDASDPPDLEALLIRLEVVIDHLQSHWKTIKGSSWPLGEDGWD